MEEKRMLKKVLIMVMAVALVFAFVACNSGTPTKESASATESAATESEKDTAGDTGEPLEIVVTLQSQQINFWSNVQHTMERLAEENGAHLTVMDINSDVTTFQNIIDDIVAMHPDGVITCGLEAATLTTHVKTLQQAGIPTVTFNIAPDEDICPMVVADQVEFGRVAGRAAADIWKEKHPDVKPVGGAVDLYSAPACALRVQGFVEGMKEIYPDFEVVQSVDGGGSRSTSLAATEDMLQAHPEINVIFGINSDSGLGALDALREVNRGTINDAIVACVDGTEGDCAELRKPDSALKAVAGNSPRIMAETAWALLMKVLSGELPADKGFSEKMNIVSVTPDMADQWVAENFE
jgi:ribose transport system substrate-binding protein